MRFATVMIVFFLLAALSGVAYPACDGRFAPVRQAMVASDYDGVAALLEKQGRSGGLSRDDRFCLSLYEGIFERMLGNYYSAYDRFAEAAKLLEGARDGSRVSLFYREQGLLHYYAGSYARAEKYLGKSIEWADRDSGVSRKERQITEVFAELVRSRRGKPKEAVDALQRIAGRATDPQVGAVACLALADASTFFKKPEKVLPALNKARAFLRQGGASIYLNQDIFDVTSAQLVVENNLLPAGELGRYVQVLKRRMESALGDGSVVQMKRIAYYQDMVKRAVLGLLQSSGPGLDENVFMLAQLIGMSTVSSAYTHGATGRRAAQGAMFAASLSEIQRALKPDEVVLQYLFGQTGGFGRYYDKGYCIYITRNDSGVVKLRTKTSDIKDYVATLRAALDLRKMQLFPVQNAYNLYLDVLAPAEKRFGQKTKLYVLPDGPLEQLPLSVLLTGPVKQLKDYKSCPWLIKKYATSVLPSYQAVLLGSGNPGALAARPSLVGFGDPSLGGGNEWQRGIRVEQVYQGDGRASARKLAGLSNLPETREELKEISRLLNGGSRSRLFFGGEATERQVRSTDLSRADVLVFATHGLVAGDFNWLNEPALVLTPVDDSVPENDGLLKASEIAQLKIGARLVVLSACNTAAGDGTETGEGLSGLAQGFFYAGVKNAIVSHWSVESRAATLLTTYAMAEYAANPGAGFSRAMQKSMLRVMRERFPAPAYWAPFVVVGAD